MLNKKILLAPILAVTLALLLAGAVSFLPQTILQSPPSPQPTSNPIVSAIPSPATASNVALASVNDSMTFLFVFSFAAIIVGVVAAFLFFSEKKLNKEISA